eukprot:7134267-Heterocapsa_arctica.AAC.1
MPATCWWLCPTIRNCNAGSLRLRPIAVHEHDAPGLSMYRSSAVSRHGLLGVHAWDPVLGQGLPATAAGMA